MNVKSTVSKVSWFKLFLLYLDCDFAAAFGKFNRVLNQIRYYLLDPNLVDRQPMVHIGIVDNLDLNFKRFTLCTEHVNNRLNYLWLQRMFFDLRLEHVHIEQVVI